LPRWSPDGRQIACADQQPGRPWKIFLVSADGGTPQEVFAEKENQNDVDWSPDGKQLVFGRIPLPGTTDTIAIKILDLATKSVSTVPGSENLYAPRWSPDGQHLVAVSADSKKLLLYDFKTEKWTDWVSSPDSLGVPSWSKDGAYVYYLNVSGDAGTYRRIRVGANKPELVVDFGNLHLADFMIGLTPDGSALFTRDVSADEIYSLEVELP
jgi:Tol biopolymer transport system component